MEEFEAYFFKKYPSLENELNTKTEFSNRANFRKVFLTTARSFFQIAFKQMKKRFPAHNSLLMKADRITLKNAKVIDSPRTIIAHFPNVIQAKDSNRISNEFKRLDYQRADLFDEIRYNLATQSWSGGNN